MPKTRKKISICSRSI